MATSSQEWAICRNIADSLSDLAVFAQHRLSSANSRHSVADVMMCSYSALLSCAAKELQMSAYGLIACDCRIERNIS